MIKINKKKFLIILSIILIIFTHGSYAQGCSKCPEPSNCPPSCLGPASIIDKINNQNQRVMSGPLINSAGMNDIQSPPSEENQDQTSPIQVENLDPEHPVLEVTPSLPQKIKDKIDSTKDEYLLSIFALITVAFISFIIIRKIIFKKRRPKEHNEIREKFGYMEEHFDNLLEYIKKNLKIGYDQETIKGKLVEACHNPRFIDEIFEKIINKK